MVLWTEHKTDSDGISCKYDYESDQSQPADSFCLLYVVLGAGTPTDGTLATGGRFRKGNGSQKRRCQSI